jgi:sugar phosphate isomerase/epimerase
MPPQSKSTPLRWGISTLGCPGFSLSEVCDLASEFRLSALELRALWGRTDLPACATEKGWMAQRAAELFAHHSVQAVVAGSDFKLADNDTAARIAFLDYCQWAESWKIPYVRVFGGRPWGHRLAETDFSHAVQTVQWWQRERQSRGWHLDLLLETHSAFCESGPCCELLRRLDRDALGLIWDSHHTWRLGNESPAHSWSRLAPWIRHVHLKDSIAIPSDGNPFTYVLPGDGQMPLAELIALLRGSGFRDVVSLEWERLWHPALPPLRIALSRLQSQTWF